MSPEIRRVIGASNVSKGFSVYPLPSPELHFSIYTAPHVAYVIICSDRLNNSIYSYQPPSIPLSLPRGWSRCGGLEPWARWPSLKSTENMLPFPLKWHRPLMYCPSIFVNFGIFPAYSTIMCPHPSSCSQSNSPHPFQVTIVPRGGGALGFAQYLPQEIFLRSKEQILVCTYLPPVHFIEFSAFLRANFLDLPFFNSLPSAAVWSTSGQGLRRTCRESLRAN